MKRVRVLVYHADEAQQYAALIRAPRGRVIVDVASKPDEASAALAETDVLYAWRFPPALYTRASRVRWLQAMGAGVDWALVPELPSGVVVTRTPGIFGPWMAEYVLGWCSWVTQRIAQYQDAQRQRRWRDDLLPDRLAGKTLVIVGLGDIGRTIAKAARRAGLRVVGVSRSGGRQSSRRGSGAPMAGVDRVFRTTELARALKLADFVALTVPLTPETRGMIGARELAAIPRTAWLINIARGAIVEEAALVDALRGGRIGGAILDVFAEEPLPANHSFWALPNVAITPHISGPSTPPEIAPIFNDNLARFLAGRRLRHIVDRGRSY